MCEIEILMIQRLMYRSTVHLTTKENNFFYFIIMYKILVSGNIATMRQSSSINTDQLQAFLNNAKH